MSLRDNSIEEMLRVGIAELTAEIGRVKAELEIANDGAQFYNRKAADAIVLRESDRAQHAAQVKELDEALEQAVGMANDNAGELLVQAATLAEQAAEIERLGAEGADLDKRIMDLCAEKLDEKNRELSRQDREIQTMRKALEGIREDLNFDYPPTSPRDKSIASKVSAALAQLSAPQPTVKDSLSVHDYTSTACQHGLHDRCRKACKFCSTECRCPCHPSAPPKPELSKSRLQELADAEDKYGVTVGGLAADIGFDVGHPTCTAGATPK